jgi:ribosomal protein L32
MSDEPTKFILGDTAISSVEEPGRKRFFHRKNREHPPLTHCENCGAKLRGHWCAQCGQPAIDYRRSFRHVIVDVLDSFLNWDSKFFATLGLLISKPWRLTNDFLAGKRVRYVHPARLYLLASILFFFAVTYWVKSAHLNPKNLTPQARAEIEADLEKKNLTPEQRANVERALKILPPETGDKIEQAIKRKDTPAETPKMEDAPDKEPEAKKPDRRLREFDNTDSASTPNRFEKWIEGRAKEKLGERGTNLQLFLITMISNVPYMVLCCIPLFAFVLKILYLRKRVFYIDHLVYALHIHTFAYLAIMLIVLATLGLNRAVPGVLAGWIVGLLWTIFAVQIFLSIRCVYQQGWFVTVFKFFVGGFIYLIVLSVALAATFFITLAMP